MSTAFDMNARKRGTGFDPKDLDGDGIPDGAEVTMVREVMGQDGNKTRMTAKWQKGTPPPEGTFPAGAQPAATPAAGAPPMPISPDARRRQEWDAFQARTDRTSDRMGIGRSNVTERPVLDEDRIYALSQKAGNTALSVDVRRNAQRELDRLNSIMERDKDRGAMLDRAALEADALSAKEGVKRDVAEISGNSRVDAAFIRATSAQETQARANEVRMQEGEADRAVKREQIQSKETIAQARIAESARRRDAVTAAKDASGKAAALDDLLNAKLGKTMMDPGKSLREYILQTYDMATGQKRAGAEPDPVFEQNIPFLNAEWARVYGKPLIGGGQVAPAAATPPATQSPGKPATPAANTMDKFRRK
jgi:hypothetical protein